MKRRVPRARVTGPARVALSKARTRFKGDVPRDDLLASIIDGEALRPYELRAHFGGVCPQEDTPLVG